MAANVVLEVLLNKKYHFMVVFARDKTFCDLRCEIQRCAGDVFPKLGEIEVTVIKTETGARIPGRFKVGEILQNGSKIFSFSSDYKSPEKKKRKKKDYEETFAKRQKLSNKPKTRQSKRNLKQKGKFCVNGSKNRRQLSKKGVTKTLWKKFKDFVKTQEDFTEKQANRMPDVTKVNGNDFAETFLADMRELQTEGMAESVSCIRANITSPRKDLEGNCNELQQKLPLSRISNRKEGMTHDNLEVNSSEAVLRASNYKQLFDLDEYCHPRKRKAVETSASKVAKWLWSSDASSLPLNANQENEENHSGCETRSVENCDRESCSGRNQKSHAVSNGKSSTPKVVENAEQTAELNRWLERDGEMMLDADVTSEQRPQRPSSQEHVHNESGHVQATESMNGASRHTPERREPYATRSATYTITGNKSLQANERELQRVDKNSEKSNAVFGNGEGNKNTFIPSSEARVEIDARVRRRIRTCQIPLQKLPLDIDAIMTNCLLDNTRLHVRNTRSRENDTTLQETWSNTRETFTNNVTTGEQISLIEGANKIGRLSSKTCGLESPLNEQHDKVDSNARSNCCDYDFEHENAEEGRINIAAVKSSVVEGEADLDRGRSPSVLSDREKRNTSRYILRSLSKDERSGNHEMVPAIESTDESAKSATGNPISSNNAPECLTTVSGNLKNIECTTNGSSHSPVKSRDSDVSRDLSEKGFVQEKSDKDPQTRVHQSEDGNSGSDYESETEDEAQAMEDNTKAPIREVMHFELYKKGKHVVFWKEAEAFQDDRRNSLRNSFTNHEKQDGKLAVDRKSIPSPRGSVPMKEKPPSGTEVYPLESRSGEALQGIENEETRRFTKNDGNADLESADETEVYSVDEKSENSINDKIKSATSKLDTEHDVEVSGEGKEQIDLHDTRKVLITEAEEVGNKKSADSATNKENENTFKENQRGYVEGREKGNNYVNGKNETVQKIHGDFEGEEEKQDEIGEEVKGKGDKAEVSEYEGEEESQGVVVDEAKKEWEILDGSDFFNPWDQFGNQNPVHEDEENDFLAGKKQKDNLEDVDQAEITKTKQSSSSDSEYEKDSKRKRKCHTENLREKGTKIEFEESTEESEGNEVQNLKTKARQEKLKRRSNLQSEESVPERAAAEILSPPGENGREIEFKEVKGKDGSEHNEVQNLAKKEGRKERRRRIKIYSEDSISERSSTEIMSPPNLQLVESISSERTMDDSGYGELSPQLATKEKGLFPRKADTPEERLNQEAPRKKNEKVKEMTDDSVGEDENLVLNKTDELVQQILKEGDCEGQECMVGKTIEKREKGRKRSVNLRRKEIDSAREESQESDQENFLSDHSIGSKKSVKGNERKGKGSDRTQLMSPESGEKVDLSQELSLPMAFEETEKVKEKIGRHVEGNEGDLAIEKNEVAQQETDAGEQENATEECTAFLKRSKKAKKTKMAVVEEAVESDMMVTNAPSVCRDAEIQDSKGNENSLVCDRTQNVFSGNDVTDENMDCDFPISVNKRKPKKRKKERTQTLEEGGSVLTNSETKTHSLSIENAGGEKITKSDSVVSTDFEKSKKRKKRITENSRVENTLITDKMQVEDSVSGESQELSNQDVMVPKEIFKVTKTKKETVENAREEDSDLVIDKAQLESSVSGEKERLFEHVLKKAGKIKKKRKHEGVVSESIQVESQGNTGEKKHLSQELEASVGKKLSKTKRYTDQRKRINHEGLIVDSTEGESQGNVEENEDLSQELEASVSNRKSRTRAHKDRKKRSDEGLASDSTRIECNGNANENEDLNQVSVCKKKPKTKRNADEKKTRKDEGNLVIDSAELFSQGNVEEDEDLSQVLEISVGTKHSKTKRKTYRKGKRNDGCLVSDSTQDDCHGNAEGNEDLTQELETSGGKKKSKTKRKTYRKGKRNDGCLVSDSTQDDCHGNAEGNEDLTQELETSGGKKKSKTKRKTYRKGKRNDGCLVSDSTQDDCHGNAEGNEDLTQELETSGGKKKSKTKRKTYRKGKRNDGCLVSDSTQEDCLGNAEGNEDLTQGSKSKRKTSKKKQRKDEGLAIVKTKVFNQGNVEEDEDLSQELVASECTKKSKTKQNTDRNPNRKNEENGLTVKENSPASVNTNGEQERGTQEALLRKGTERRKRKRCSEGKIKDSDLLTGACEKQDDVKDKQASQPKEKASAKKKGKMCLSLLELVEDAEQESSHLDKTRTPRASNRKSYETLTSRFLQTPQGFLDTTKQRKISTSTTGLQVKHRSRTRNTESLNLKPLTPLEQELVSSRVSLKQLLADDSFWEM